METPTPCALAAGAPVRIDATFLRKASEEDRPGEAVIRLPDGAVVFVPLAAVEPK